MHAPFVLAHPLTETDALPLPPVAVAAIAVTAVLLTAVRPLRTPVEPDPDADPTPPPSAWAQAPAVGLLVLAVAAGRTGANRVTANIAPALVVGAGWPLLIVASVLLGPVWQRINPWDGLARLFIPMTHDDEHPQDASDVRPALITAVALVWYLHAYRQALLPRSVGAAVALYTVATVAGCLAVGRATWLSRVEIVSIFLGWVGRIRHRGLAAWDVPRGAAPVVGVLAGGFVFGLLRYSRLLNPLVFDFHTVLPPETVGLVISCLVTVALVVVVRWWEARHGSSGAAVAAAVPVVAGLALAASLVRGQALIAAQLLPILASDPFGRGWDLFGTAGWVPNPNPLGDTWHVVLQVALIVAGGVLGAAVARRRVAGRGPLAPAATTVAALVAAGVLAVTAA